MKITLKKLMGILMVAALLAGGVVVQPKNAQASSYEKTYSVIVGKKVVLSHMWEGGAKWKVIKGQANVKILKQSAYGGATIKGLKKGTALVQADIGGSKSIQKVKVIGKTITVTYTGKKFTKSKKEEITSAGTAGAKIKMVVKKGVKSIGNEAFYQLPITEVKIPGSVKSIGKLAFWYCDKLKSVKIPSSVTNIEKQAFDSCTALKSINIPSGVKSIKEAVFSDCAALKSIKIPGSVTSIGNYAFADCEKLKSVNIPSSVKSIGNWVFSGCNALKSINISSGVTSIGEEAFLSCKSLKSINIPDSVTKIGEYIFRNCDSLKSITWKGVTYSSIDDFEEAL